MREFAKISPQIWISERGKKLKSLGIEAQFLAFYLSTSPHAAMIGIYYLPIVFIAHETGLRPENIMHSLHKLSEINFCSYDESSEYIWVHDFASDQIGTKLKFNDNRVKAINESFSGLPNLPFLDKFLEKYAEDFHLTKFDQVQEGPSEPLRSKEKDKEKEKENEKEKNNDNEEIAPQETHDDDIHSFEKDKNIPDQDSGSVEEQAKRILDFFNEYVPKPYPPTEENLRLITACLHEGYLEKVCFYVIANKYREWKTIDKMRPFFQLHVIFGKKFPKYVSELPAPKFKG